ncbi:1-deoxy-D-xylulose-5-phosphate reductoisomerase [Helicobacter sp. 23-1045]
MILLGSTGSIGTQALQIARAEHLSVEVLCAGDNIELLNAQIAEFCPKIVVIKDSKKKHLIRGINRVLCGESGILEAINTSESKLVLNALVGFSGVNPSIESIKCGKTLALANKESLVVAGFLMGGENLARILPVDSEHFALKELLDSATKNAESALDSANRTNFAESAFFSSLRGARSVSECNEAIHKSNLDCHELLRNSRNDGISGESTIKKLIITASGGAFRDLPLSEIPHQSAKSALNHPTWAMGRKITIDSATMINKLFEILEAYWLFGANLNANLATNQGVNSNTNHIDAVIERTSTIHALIQSADNAIITHLSSNDMRLPIATALLGAKAKCKAFIKELDLLNLNLRFEKIDTNRYPLWTLKDSLLKCPKLGIILNAANDILVAQFLENKIIFGDIATQIFKVVERFGDESALDTLQNIADIAEINAKIADFLR